MNEVKRPKKPLIYYYSIVVLILLLFNFLAMPWIAQRQVREVDYGTFMDMAPALLIFTPIFLPIVRAFGMSDVQFGVMMVMNLAVGTITPPVGNVLFVGCSLAKQRLENVMKSLVPFFVAIFISLMLVTYIPALSEWLPTTLGLM